MIERMQILEFKRMFKSLLNDNIGQNDLCLAGAIEATSDEVVDYAIYANPLLLKQYVGEYFKNNRYRVIIKEG